MRLTSSASYGTYGGAAFTYPTALPTRSDTVLVTSYSYDAAGRTSDITDPRGIVGHTEYDLLGRTVKTVAAYTDGVPTASTNSTVTYTYNGSGLLSAMTLVLPAGAVQTTGYVYGVSSANGSTVTRNDLLATMQYPNASTGLANSSDTESYAYNALGERIVSTGRDGTTHAFDRDAVGRLIADRVTVLGSGVDGSIRRIEYGYNTQMRLSSYTSFDAVSGGNVVNQTSDYYNGLGQQVSDYQTHNGAVTRWQSPSVTYQYTEMSGGSNASRLTGHRLPHPAAHRLRLRHRWRP